MPTMTIAATPTTASRLAMRTMTAPVTAKQETPAEPLYLTNPVKYYTDKVMTALSKVNTLEDYGRDGVEINVEHWLEVKEPLFNLFRNHPNWNEEAKQIVYKTEVCREVDTTKARSHLFYITGNQYMSKSNPDHALYFTFKDIKIKTFLTEEDAEALNTAYPDGRFKAGQKYSRVANKVLIHYGFDKYPNYNKDFAAFADAVNPLKVTAITTISVNILDYLFMSNGNSWSSCHTIINNSGQNYGGCYRAGTLSYALDNCTIIFSVIDSNYDGKDYSEQKKIFRQTFFYEDGFLSQQRLYPQENDNTEEGASFTKQFRNLVEDVIATCENKPNLWKKADIRYNSIGYQYADYACFTAHRYKMSEIEEESHTFEVGGVPYCIVCGEQRDDGSNRWLSCKCCRSEALTCYECGCDIDEDEDFYINGHWYCWNCSTTCDHCGDHIAYGESISDDNIELCEYCFNQYYIRCDDCNSLIQIRGRRTDDYYVTASGRTICDSCYGDDYFTCDDCGEIYHWNDRFEHDGDYLCEDCYDSAVEEEEEE